MTLHEFITKHKLDAKAIDDLITLLVPPSSNPVDQCNAIIQMLVDGMPGYEYTKRVDDKNGYICVGRIGESTKGFIVSFSPTYGASPQDYYTMIEMLVKSALVQLP